MGFHRWLRLKSSVLLIVLWGSVSPSQASLNVAELKDVNYEVSIDDVPHGYENFKLNDNLVSNGQYVGGLPPISDAIKGDSNSVVVTSEHGQKFVCSIPVPPEPKKDTVPEQKLTVSVVADVVSAAFYTQNCISKNMGWWTYELCYGKQVEQYHLNGDKVENVNSVGFYHNDSELPTFKPKMDRPLYFEQHYPNGELCDLTGKPRYARVRYYCDELLETNQAYVERVEEASSCEYLLRVRVGSLCKLPAFLAADRPPPSLGIVCRPLLDDKKSLSYINELIVSRDRKAEAKAKMEHFLQRAESTQRQRYARHRLGYKHLRDTPKWKAKEKLLKTRYKADVKAASRIAFEADGTKGADIHFVVDDFGEMKNGYTSERDEDRGNLYWYFKDPLWDRTFFPATSAHVRATNRYYSAMSVVWEQVRHANLPVVKKSLATFLRRIEEGVVGEMNLNIIFGFFEGLHDDESLPGLDMEVSRMYAVWLSDEAQLDLEKRFEGSVVRALVERRRLRPDAVMSKVARQILEMRTRLSVENQNKIELFTFVKAEEIFKRFAEAYNRAVNNFNQLSVGRGPQGDVDEAEVFRGVNGVPHRSPGQKNDYDSNNEASRKDSGEPLTEEEVRQSKSLAVSLATGTSEAEGNEAEKRALEVVRETRAMKAMKTRAKRTNLRRVFEEYLRKPIPGEWEKVRPVEDQVLDLEKKLLLFKQTLETKLKEAGVTGGASIKVQLLSTSGEIIGTESDEGMNAIVKALLKEESDVNDEQTRLSRLQKGYAFGAKQPVADDADDDTDLAGNLESELLPLIDKLLNM